MQSTFSRTRRQKYLSPSFLNHLSLVHVPELLQSVDILDDALASGTAQRCAVSDMSAIPSRRF
jgi:hypothetical protein